MVDHGTLVLSRRIRRPPERVAVVLAALVDGRVEPLRDLTPFERRACGAARPAERTATALLRTGRTVERVELEIGPWSATATELRLRPAARHPERWSGRRVERYFAEAHRAADAVVARLETLAPAPPVTPAWVATARPLAS